MGLLQFEAPKSIFQKVGQHDLNDDHSDSFLRVDSFTDEQISGSCNCITRPRHSEQGINQ